ncbi:MAG: hypothetical protein JNK26_03930 [Candidatus Doudnabacteria bacterium]|nr:hypothetical protein [Candidatus Doudnabacteria bacterium]
MDPLRINQQGENANLIRPPVIQLWQEVLFRLARELGMEYPLRKLLLFPGLLVITMLAIILSRQYEFDWNDKPEANRLNLGDAIDILLQRNAICDINSEWVTPIDFFKDGSILIRQDFGYFLQDPEGQYTEINLTEGLGEGNYAQIVSIAPNGWMIVEHGLGFYLVNVLESMSNKIALSDRFTKYFFDKEGTQIYGYVDNELVVMRTDDPNVEVAHIYGLPFDDDLIYDMVSYDRFVYVTAAIEGVINLVRIDLATGESGIVKDLGYYLLLLNGVIEQSPSGKVIALGSTRGFYLVDLKTRETVLIPTWGRVDDTLQWKKGRDVNSVISLPYEHVLIAPSIGYEHGLSIYRWKDGLASLEEEPLQQVYELKGPDGVNGSRIYLPQGFNDCKGGLLELDLATMNVREIVIAFPEN